MNPHDLFFYALQFQGNEGWHYLRRHPVWASARFGRIRCPLRIARLGKIGDATKAAARQLEGWIQKIGSDGEEVVNADGTISKAGEISS